jgi:hypothetical protein
MIRANLKFSALNGTPMCLIFRFSAIYRGSSISISRVKTAIFLIHVSHKKFVVAWITIFGILCVFVGYGNSHCTYGGRWKWLKNKSSFRFGMSPTALRAVFTEKALRDDPPAMHQHRAEFSRGTFKSRVCKTCMIS